jgi:hypothetical protein
MQAEGQESAVIARDRNVIGKLKNSLRQWTESAQRKKAV